MRSKWEKKLPMKLLKNLITNYSLLITLVFLGTFFRFYNLNWDQGHFFHPDERNIALAVSRIHFFDQLDPGFFAYGSFPIYFYRAIGDFLVLITENPNWVSDWVYINLIGRGVSAFLSSLTILLIFLLTKKFFNEKIGVLVSFLVAFTPSLIQTAHFGVTENMLIFWLILLSIFSFEISQKPTFKNYLKTGIILGLAVATKISALSFLVIPVTAQLLYYFKYLKYHLRFLFSVFVAFLTFTIFSPYVFLDFQKFSESMTYESGVATGRLRVVYVLQFERTLPYLFQIKNFFWQMGPVALFGILGTILLLVIAIKNRDKRLLILLSFPVVYFVYVGSWYTKFIRFMVPVLPFLAIFAAWFLYRFWEKFKILGGITLTLTLTLTFLWSLAFFLIYTRQSTRITASYWIYQNIPQGAKILGEHWDDGLPIDISRKHPNWYQIKQLTIYEADNPQKIEYYAQELSQADYIIINSRRLYGTLMYLPEKYLITSHYYKLLFAGKLGYQKIAEFSSYPSLFGITINDDSSEETFQVYDHPKVLIFKNNGHFSSKVLKNILFYD